MKDRIGSTIRTHYPEDRQTGVDITRQEAGIDLEGPHPVVVPPFMDALVEEISVAARKSPYVDHESGVSARFATANWRAMVASARRRGIMLGESPAVPRISDLAHLHATAAGKLELDLMGSHQMDERRVLDAIVAEAVANVFRELVVAAGQGVGGSGDDGLEAIADAFGKGVRLEVGDLVPSTAYAGIMERIPEIWPRAFDVNPAADPAVRASCAEFLLAGLHATDRISRSERFGRTIYESER